MKSFQAISRARAFNSLKSRVFVCLLQIRLRLRLTCCTFDRLENSLVRAAHHRPEKGNKISLLTSLHPSSSCCCCFFIEDILWLFFFSSFTSLTATQTDRQQSFMGKNRYKNVLMLFDDDKIPESEEEESW